MPKISQITTASAPSLSDKLIGTSVGGFPSNQTNNFTLQEIKNLFDGGPTPPSPTLQSVLNAGNTAIQNIYLTGTIEAVNLTIANNASSKNLYLAERFFDRNNSAGTNGQYLTSTGSGVQWSTLTIPIPTLQQVLTAGNVSDKNITTTGNIQGANIQATNITANSNLRVVGTLSDSTNSVGGTGQVLSSTGTGTDWVDLPSYSAVSPLIYNNVSRQFSIQQATSTQNGYLSSADWITFDGKQNAGNYITALTGEASALGPGSVNITLNNLAVINKTLTGFTTLTGTVTAADSIISAFGKLQGQLQGIVAGVTYMGVWNAAINNPTLVSSVGIQGHYYVVDVAGNTNLNGITDWKIGDWAIFNGTSWEKVDNTDAVISVNGQIGIVVLNTDNINEGSNNLYYTNTRARNAVSSLATGLTYTASTGVFSLTSGYSIPTIANQTDWTTAYNETIVSAAVTGTTTKTLTLTQQDGGTITASWTDIDTNLVTSVFGRTGAVVAQSGDYTTTLVTEGTNLYYLDSRARSAISSTAQGLTYTPSTGVFSLTSGYSIPTDLEQADWDTAYNNSIVSAAVTGTSTKTLTLTQQDGGTITADWSDADTGLTSVGVSMPLAFSVSNSPLTSNGTIAITGAGTNLQYIDGTGALQTFPSLTGFVPYTGATQAVELGINSLSASFLRVDGNSPSSGSYLGFKHSTSVNTGADGYTSMYTFGTNTIGFKSISGATNKDFSFDMSTITSNVPGGRVYSMPDANGTLALTSDIPSVSDFVTKSTNQTITGLKTIVRSGDVLDFKIGTDTLYGLKLFYSQNELVPSGEATWSFVNTFNRDGSGYETTPLSFFRGVLVTGERLLSSSINANLLDYYSNNPTGRYPVYAYNTGVQQFASSIIVGEQTGVVNPVTGAISDLPSGVVANFHGRAIGSDAVNSNEFVTLGQVSSPTGYVPYTGALTNVNLGTYGLLSDFVQFNLAPTSLPTVQGTMYWDTDKETVDVVLNGTTGSIFQDTFFFVKNQTGASIPKGTVVRANGTVGSSGRILVTPFLANGSVDSKFCLGVTTELINDGEDGRVTYFGSIRGIDTSMYPAGTVLYASPSVVGGFTATEPSGPTNNIVSVAIVVNSSVNNGSIFVRPTFIPSAVDISKSLNYTPANAATTLTINGTTYDLSANRTWSVGTVTSVGLSVPTGFSIGSSPVTTSGTLALTYTSGYSLPTNASQANWDTAYANRITSLTTTGTSGAATLTSNVLNIPQYQAQGNYITALTGEVTASGPGSASATLSNSAVTGKVLTGLNVTGSAILDTDSILVAFGKLQNQVNQLVGGLQYEGTWNASTNTPTITSSVGTNGTFYIVSVAGNTNINGITDWQVGDWIVFHDTSWQKVDNTESVSSVFGRVGNITAAQSDYSAFYPLIADIKNGVLTVQGTGVLSGSGTFSANQATNNTITLTHGSVSRTNTTSTQSPAFGGTFTAIDSITSSTEGHITAVNTKTVTIPNTTAPNNATITLSAGSGISGGGDFTTDQSFNETISFSHGATSTQPSVNNSGRTFIQDITLDAFGHVTGLVSATDSDTFTGTVTSVSGTGGYGGLTLSGTVTTSGNITLGGTPTGTWPISISGNAETVDGFSASQSTIGNGIVVRDVNGYIFGNYINMTDDGNPGGGASITSFITKQGDNYYRSVSPASAANSIRGGASGTWPISISGNAETVDGYSVSVAGSANTIPTRNSSGYLIPENWIQLNGTYGLYSPTNSAHFYPNNLSYGSWRVEGDRNGWRGLHFGGSTGMTLMMNETEFGFHREGYGWYARFTPGTGHFNITGSAASASNSTFANNISLTSLGNGSVNVNNGASAVYRNENSAGAVYPYAPVLHIGGGDTMWQMQGSYGTSGNGSLFFRQGYAGSWGNWLNIITEANINSQSVSYAYSAGSAQFASYASTAGSAQFASGISISNSAPGGDYGLLFNYYGSVYNNTGGLTYTPDVSTVNVFAYDPSYGTNNNIQIGRITKWNSSTTTGLVVNNPAYGFQTWISQTDLGVQGYGNYCNMSYGAVSISSSGQGGGQGGGFAGFSVGSVYGNDSSSGQWSMSDHDIYIYSNYYAEGFNYRGWQNGDLYIGGVLYQNQWSDAKYKDNVVEIQSALDKVKSIRGVEYDWNQLAFDETGREGHDVGVIAQEVQSVYPFAVREVDKEKDDHVQTALVVDYEKLIPLLLQSIKELSAEVDKLKNLQ